MLEEEFFTELNIAPIGLLSDCQFENEFRLGVCYGDDICEFVDDSGYNCSNCSKSEPIHLYYPPITDFVLLNLVLMCGIPEKVSMTDIEQQKQDILVDVLVKCNNRKTKQKVVEFLNNYLCEFKLS